ncbi:MAG TPA: hypothetical protein VHU13_07205 [Solirubrobacteraceae bacterium]|jgi:hypothetical protein|nr:hypothetical protein [Solirubrobacteraceae bacterium]
MRGDPALATANQSETARPTATRAALLVCIFHLNLAFSSLEEREQPRIVERCYWPMLDLVRRTGFPIAIEATGWTLERIASHDRSWIEEVRRLIAGGQLELVGSAYAQCAAPLLPAEVNGWNLRLGLDVYRDLLSVRPRLALVCEQAYAPGLVDLYRDAGLEAIVADWDNAYRSHPEWPLELRRYPQLARGTSSTLPVVWSESIAFQKFQRFAHGELTHAQYRDYVANATGEGGMLMLYANDAEVFDNRPGRFAAEPPLTMGEWDRIAEGLKEIVAAQLGSPALPSKLLGLLELPEAGHELVLETADQPIPVKKQDKYNIGRWAVTGRDDVGINTRCWRIYRQMHERRCDDPEAWRELCALWASDFRTHVTDARWAGLLTKLERCEARWGVSKLHPARSPPRGGEPVAGVSRSGTLVRVKAGPLTVALNARRGLAIHEFCDARQGETSMFGTLEHGYFSTIELGADWYSGNLVQETPLHHKITDLEPVEPAFERLADDGVRVRAQVATELGTVEKTITVDGQAAALAIDYTLRWRELPPGSLRVGHVTINPEAFDPATLWYATHNGGAGLERHEIAGAPFDHGAPVSALVSSRQGLGLTGGVVLIGDAQRHLHIHVDPEIARPLGLIAFRSDGERYFLRLSLSLGESDDTRRCAIAREAQTPQRLRLVVSARANSRRSASL